MTNICIGAATLLVILVMTPAWAKDKSQPIAPPVIAQPQVPTIPVQPVASGVVGQWGCQFSYTELTPQGGRASGFTREFMIAFYPNGSFEAQGTEAGASGYSQFQSQGQWQDGGGAGVLAQGQIRSNDPYAIPGMIFAFAGQLQPDGSMAYRYEQPDPNQQYVMNRSLYQCQRQG